MKKKSPKGSVQAAPMPIAKNNPSDEIPAILKQFEGKSPGQAIKEIILPSGASEGDQKLLAGIVSGFCDIGISVPAWAKRASEKFIEGICMEFLQGLQPDAEDSQFAKGLGTVIGLGEEMLKQPAPPSSNMSKIQNELLNPVVEFSKSAASKAEPAAAAAFFNGRNETGKLVEKMQNLSQRTKIYGIISACWQQIEEFKSTGELYEWIMSQKTLDRRPSVAPQTDSREIRKICKEIGLKFQNKWQKVKPDAPAPAFNGKSGISSPT